MKYNKLENTINSLDISRAIGVRHSEVKRDLRLVIRAFGLDPDFYRDHHQGFSRERTVLNFDKKILLAYAETQGFTTEAKIRGMIKGLKHENKLMQKFFKKQLSSQ